jgi:hypothetical protein
MARLAARRPPIAIRLLSAPVVGATLAAGVWVAGGVLTNDFRASVALTAAWFAVCGAACLAVALRARAFRLPVVGGYAVAAAAIGGYLAFATFHDRVVDEPIAPGVELLRAGFRGDIRS